MLQAKSPAPHVQGCRASVTKGRPLRPLAVVLVKYGSCGSLHFSNSVPCKVCALGHASGLWIYSIAAKLRYFFQIYSGSVRQIRGAFRYVFLAHANIGRARSCDVLFWHAVAHWPFSLQVLAVFRSDGDGVLPFFLRFLASLLFLI
jgi:hypothetical protein